MKNQSLATIAIGALMVGGLTTAAVRNWPYCNPQLTAQICVERAGNNGALNIRDANVMIKGGPGLILSGGAAACAFVEGGGKYTVWAQSPDPYDPTSTNPAAWRSKNLEIDVPEHGHVELELDTEAKGAAYHNWELHRAEQGCD